MNEITSNKIPKLKNAAIFPAIGILRISKMKSFSNVMENNVKDIIRKGLYLYRMPSHMKPKEHSPHKIGKPVLIYTLCISASELLLL